MAKKFLNSKICILKKLKIRKPKKKHQTKQENPNIGRPDQKPTHIKNRKKYFSKSFRALAAYWNAFSTSELFIYKRISDDNPVQDKSITKIGNLIQRISSFIVNKRKFLCFLALAVQNRFKTIKELLLMKDNAFQTQQTTQVSSRTFLALLMLYSRQFNENKQNNWDKGFKIQIGQIKILYLLSILIVGIPSYVIHLDQINFNNCDNSIIESYFKSNIWLLCEKTKLLNTLVFQKLQKYWNFIVQLVHKKLQENEQIYQKKSKKRRKNNFHKRNEDDQEKILDIIEEQPEIEDYYPEKIQQSMIYEKKNYQYQDLQQQHGTVIIYQKQQQDEEYDEYFLNENSSFIEFQQYQMMDHHQIKNEQQKEQKKQTQKLEFQSVATQEYNGNQLIKQEISQKKQNAHIFFNYQKINTRPRDSTSIFEIKRIQKQQIMRQNIAFQAQNYYQTSLGQTNPEYANSINSLTIDNFFDDELTQQQQSILASQESQEQEIDQYNPNRHVSHQNRQIDTLCNFLLDDEKILAYSIANYIYSATKAQKIEIIF